MAALSPKMDGPAPAPVTGRYAGKTTIITGGSKGIGEGCTRVRTQRRALRSREGRQGRKDSIFRLRQRRCRPEDTAPAISPV